MRKKKKAGAASIELEKKKKTDAASIEYEKRRKLIANMKRRRLQKSIMHFYLHAKKN